MDSSQGLWLNMDDGVDDPSAVLEELCETRGDVGSANERVRKGVGGCAVHKAHGAGEGGQAAVPGRDASRPARLPPRQRAQDAHHLGPCAKKRGGGRRDSISELT